MKKPGPKPRILVVEDEALAAADIQVRLRSLGYDIAGLADTADEAIRLAKAIKPDLVLMDLMLRSEKPATEAAHHIRAQLRLPVIFLSASLGVQMVARALDADAFSHIRKPFEEALLKTQIDLALYQHRMEREREELIGKLQLALAEVKTLASLLPICAWCKNVRQDQNYWRSVEQYVRSRSSAHFTQCICPSCEEKFRQDLRHPGAWSDVSLPPG